MVKAEWFRRGKSLATFLLFSSAFVYVGVLSMLIAEVHLGRAHAAPEEDGIRGGLASAARLFHSLWPDSVNAWAIRTTERSYGEDCRVFTWEKESPLSNVVETVMDEFFLAHLIGWWAKAIIYRNRVLLWMLSIGFELCEVLFKELLPNFRECWWDSIVLDVLLCNWIGIELGMLTLTYCKMETYDWQPFDDETAHCVPLLDSNGKSEECLWEARVPGTPEERNGTSTQNGHVMRRTARGKRLHTILLTLGVEAFVCAVTLVTELSGFFIKSMLSLEPLHPFNTIRLILWAAVGLPAVKEFHDWVGAKPELSTKPWEAAEKVIDVPTPSFLYLALNIAMAELVFVLTCYS